MSLSYIVPTIGRDTLKRTLDSIELRAGDEILLVGELCPEWVKPSPTLRFIECPRGNDWGHSERNYAIPFARGTHIAQIDDDDWYAPGARDLIQSAIDANPDRPAFFRMRYPSGTELWREPVLAFGNVGTPMGIIPNVPERLGLFKSYHGGDFAFYASCLWDMNEIAWRPEVIVELGK